jgi:hypothetical protein
VSPCLHIALYICFAVIPKELPSPSGGRPFVFNFLLVHWAGTVVRCRFFWPQSFVLGMAIGPDKR